jgi:hypothetical protein
VGVVFFVSDGEFFGFFMKAPYFIKSFEDIDQPLILGSTIDIDLENWV